MRAALKLFTVCFLSLSFGMGDIFPLHYNVSYSLEMELVEDKNLHIFPLLGHAKWVKKKKIHISKMPAFTWVLTEILPKADV